MSVEMSLEPDSVRADLSAAQETLSSRAEAVLVRTPTIDADLPDCSDIDLLALGAPLDFLPERLDVSTERQIDVMWLPRHHLTDITSLATHGLIPHRILSSRVLYDSTGFLTNRHTRLAQLFASPDLRARRIAGILEMGYATVREIGVSWDSPAVALFWLHMGHAACVAALADGLGLLCPNIYTRPTATLREIDQRLGHFETERFANALHLNVDLPELVGRLRALHGELKARFPEPDWPASMREMTRWEYRYFLAEDELEWRIRAAEELARRGDTPGAVFYLRFHAYALARLPMVSDRAHGGWDENFLRPSQRVGPALARLCPDLADDIAAVLGGPQLGHAEVECALSHLQDFRARTLSCLASRGLDLPEMPSWQPFEDQATPSPSKQPTHKETSNASSG